MKKQLNNENERILILKLTIDDTKYLLVNIYNANKEQGQLKTQQNFILLENFCNFYNRNVVLAVDLISFSMKSL